MNDRSPAETNEPDEAASSDPKRRDFLILTTEAFAAVAMGAAVWPLADALNPDAATIAAGAPVDVDLKNLAPGQQKVAMWRSRPVFVTNRIPKMLASLQDKKLLDELSDPASTVLQQPPYAKNWHRSIKPDYAILVGVCTHFGCIPKYEPNPSATDPAPNWPGGFFCPCHGSKYDLAGRVFRNVPAPYNLPVPPHHFVNDTTVRIGENPEGVRFDFGSIRQI